MFLEETGNKNSKKTEAHANYEIAHISSDYRAVKLKHSSARHLLGNLFSQ